MNLQLPTIGVDSGLIWEQDVNSNTTILDSHNHAPGSGVQITPTGLNINTALAFNNNSAISLQSVAFTQQSSLATLNAIYFKTDGNAYINDGASNVIQLTSGGLVNATSSGISSGSASASFVSSVLVVNAAANTPANIQGGSLLLGNNVAASKFLTLAPPSAMGANFGLTLPSLPGSNGNFLTIDTSGNIGSSVGVDNSTLEVSSNTLRVKALGITSSQIANNTITRTQEAPVGQQISSSCGTFNTSSGTPQTVTNLSVTITTSGRPIAIFCQYAGNGILQTNGFSVVDSGTGAQAGMNVFLYKNGSPYTVFALLGPAVNPSNVNVPPSALYYLDTNGAATITYSVFIANNSNGSLNQASANNMCLVAYEL